VGINLTAATEIIIYDSDWNPQNDIQATARAHRIGQKHEVTVYRLITANTYESEMFKKASRKLGMDKAVFSGNFFKQSNGNEAEQKMSKEEV
jgi:SNF2 family DNA or RNA helicase